MHNVVRYLVLISVGAGCMVVSVMAGALGGVGGNWDPRMRGMPSPGLFYCEVDERLGGWQVRVDPHAPEIYVPGVSILNAVPEMNRWAPDWDGSIDDFVVLPHWVRTDVCGGTRPVKDGDGAVYWREEAYGWPWPCLSLARVLYHGASEFEIVDGIPLLSRPDRSWDGPWGPRRVATVPTKPYWSGLLSSWLFWTVIVAVLRFGFVAPRRVIRRRRGRCPRCGYDLQGKFNVGCAECGWNRSANEDELERARDGVSD